MSDRRNLLRWRPEGRPASSPLSLAPHAGERIELEVDEEQVVLVVEEGSVVAVFLPERHTLLVRPAEEAEERWTAEAILRHLGLDEEDRAPGTERIHSLSPRQQVLFLSLQTLPPIRWDDAGAGFELGDENACVRTTGVCRVRMSDPIRFYESFLRNSEDLDGADLDRVMTPLLASSFGRALRDLSPDPEFLPHAPESTARECLGRMREGLDRCGLELLDLHLERLEVEPASVAVEEAWTPAPVEGV